MRKRLKYLLYAVGAAVVAVLAVIFRGAIVSKTNDGKKRIAPARVPPKLQQAVQQAHEEALVEKALAKSQAEEQRQELQEIQKVDDGVERRKRLAAFIRTL